MAGPVGNPQPSVHRRFKVGEAEIRPDTNTVFIDGEERYLRQQAMQVLTYLLQRPGELVSKEELNRSVWNDTAVTDDALVQCVVEIRKALGDDPRRPRFVRTVPKGGYAFIGPVAPLFQEPATAEAGQKAALSWLPRWGLAAAALMVIIGIAAFVSWRRPAAAIEWPAQPGKTRVIVLAFENTSKQGDLDWLRRGLAEMIVTDLARSPGLNVLAPSHLVRLAGGDATATDMAAAIELAKRAKADAIVTGTYSAVGDALRVDARVYQADGMLIGSESLTAARREVVLAEIDRLAQAVSRRLGQPSSTQQSATHLSDVMTSDLSAYREYSLGVEKAIALHSDAALEHFQNAIRADPNFAMAHARIGYTYSITIGLPAKGQPYLAKAFQLKERLREQDRLTILAWYALAKLDYEGAISALRTLVVRYPDNIEHYWLLSRTLRGEERHEEALDVVTAGLRVNPNAKDLYNEMRGIHGMTGRRDLAIAAAKKYVELSPNEPNAHDSLGLDYQESGRYAEAIAAYEKALSLDPTFDIALIHLGNTFVAQGRYRDATTAYARHAAMMKTPATKQRGEVYQAWIHYFRGDAAGALRLMDAAHRDQSTPLYHLAIVALALGDRARLDAELAKPINVSIRGMRFSRKTELYMRGLKAQADGKPEEAIAVFREATRQQPVHWGIPTFDDCLAEAYFGYGRWTEAEAEFQRLLKLNANAAPYVYRLAQIAERTGRPDLAAQEYRRFLALWSTADADVPQVVGAKAWLAKREQRTTTNAAR
jgi:tetratricopeptide (TPR) repeat protein/DNA-binding winged helix-turn-helix (wHTH) protein